MVFIKQIDSKTLARANEQVIYNLYLYLVHNAPPMQEITLNEACIMLEEVFKKRLPRRKYERETNRLAILKNAILNNENLANSTIDNLRISKRGVTAGSFIKPDGEISVVFMGTGDGEWIDNGEGLSGIGEENVYIYYDTYAKPHKKIVHKDYATDQQVDALNWFNKLVAENGWNKKDTIVVSGHSKGGNKAQFVTMNSELINECYSFDGQGFSPEAIAMMQEKYGEEYEERREKIKSISADNDYVNVLGSKLVLPDNTYYVKSAGGLHYLEAILTEKGELRERSAQGSLSEYIEKISDELMEMRPRVRQYATLGVMNIFQKFLGKAVPVNGDMVSTQKTIAGIGIAVSAIFKNIN